MPEEPPAMDRIADPRAAAARTHQLMDQLSRRETQILRLLVCGFTCREIGQKLALSLRTVEIYRLLIDYKLDHMALPPGPPRASILDRVWAAG